MYAVLGFALATVIGFVLFVLFVLDALFGSVETYKDMIKTKRDALWKIVEIPLWIGLGVFVNLDILEYTLIFLGSTASAVMVYTALALTTSLPCFVVAIRRSGEAIATTFRRTNTAPEPA